MACQPVASIFGSISCLILVLATYWRSGVSSSIRKTPKSASGKSSKAGGWHLSSWVGQAVTLVVNQFEAARFASQRNESSKGCSKFSACLCKVLQ